MTPERIIEIRDSLLPSQGEAFDCLAFALAIIAETREECARVCEGAMVCTDRPDAHWAELCASAIRALKG